MIVERERLRRLMTRLDRSLRSRERVGLAGESACPTLTVAAPIGLSL